MPAWPTTCFCCNEAIELMRSSLSKCYLLHCNEPLKKKLLCHAWTTRRLFFTMNFFSLKLVSTQIKKNFLCKQCPASLGSKNLLKGINCQFYRNACQWTVTQVKNNYTTLSYYFPQLKPNIKDEKLCSSVRFTHQKVHTSEQMFSQYTILHRSMHFLVQRSPVKWLQTALQQ